LKKPITKKTAGGMAQGVSPEFKSPNCKKKMYIRYPLSKIHSCAANSILGFSDKDKY
jgi:hypothetical protein